LEIESKNGEVEYEFEKELMLLRDFYFADEHIEEYKSEINRNLKYDSDEKDAETDNNDIDDTDDTNEEVSGYEESGELGELNESDDDVKVFAGSESLNEQPETINNEPSAPVIEEEPIATYDSDDYQEEHHSHESDVENYNSEGIDNIYADLDDDDDNEEEEDVGGILGFFKGFGKRKREKAVWNNDIDNIYSDLDDDDESDDKIMSMFDGLDDEEED
jgi:hypothetical protein